MTKLLNIPFWFLPLHSLGASSLHTASDLEGVVDVPLHTSKGADHEDPGAETLPEASEANVLVDRTGGAALLVHDRDHGVSGVRDDSAEDTGKVT